MALRRTIGSGAPSNTSLEGISTSLIYLEEGDDDDPNSPLANFSIEESGDVYLARLILAQTAMDAQRTQDDYVRTCARAYLTNVSEDLVFVCEMGRVNSGYLVRTWRRLLGGVTEFPEGYESLYKKEKKWKRASE